MNKEKMSARDTDVVIVGGGPVGMGLSIELGQRGVRSIVVERYVQPQPIPKGQNLTQRTMEHFHFWGAEKELRAARTIPPSTASADSPPMTSCWVRIPTTGCNATWSSPTTTRPTSACLSTPLRQFCASGRPNCPRSRPSMAGVRKWWHKTRPASV